MGNVTIIIKNNKKIKLDKPALVLLEAVCLVFAAAVDRLKKIKRLCQS